MKDPAFLFYYDTWLTATAEFDSDTYKWYHRLLIYNYDKKSLPNNIEELAILAGVKFSEYKKFEQVFEQVFKQKFILNDSNRLENDFCKDVMRKRELFLNKRSASGKLSYVLRYFRTNFKYSKGFEEFFKRNNNLDFDIKNEQVLEQVFEQTLELFINGDGNGSINKKGNEIPPENKDSGGGEKPPPKNILYHNLIKIYDEFIQEKIGVRCKMDGREGKALQAIIPYLKNEVKNKNPELTEIPEIEKKTEEAWEYILKNWSRISPYHQDQIKISQINSNLPNILNQLKNGITTNKRQTMSDLMREIDKLPD